MGMCMQYLFSIYVYFITCRCTEFKIVFKHKTTIVNYTGFKNVGRKNRTFPLSIQSIITINSLILLLCVDENSVDSDQFASSDTI